MTECSHSHEAYLESSEVNDIVNVWVLFEDLVERSFVGDVGLVEGWSLAADELDAIDDFGRRVVEIVDDDDLVVCLEKSESCEGANVARATRMELAVAVCRARAEAHGGVEGQKLTQRREPIRQPS
ncbi:hypothetical protein HBI47_043770 [Parastagonospora nodorum]|nr:hypothetical protein HBI47_043770 [Parastagonospora nodorum]